jgi:hypothetical protein
MNSVELIEICGGKIMVKYEQRNTTHVYTNKDEWWEEVTGDRLTLKKKNNVERHNVNDTHIYDSSQ